MWTLAQAYDAIGECELALDAMRNLRAHLETIHLDTTVASLAALKGNLDGALLGARANRAELDRAEAELKVKVLQRELDRTRQEMLERMAVAADIREDISGEHGYRVGRLSALLAAEVGWMPDACSAIESSARLHDIGKFGIPEMILFSKSTLQKAERDFVASHTIVGAEILSKSDIPQVRIAEEIARCHHEWWDGSGYPRGLKGLAIPKSARIVALADVFDAMTHGRPYAQAIPIEAALDEIAGLRGRQFDPELTDHFLALVRRLAADNDDLDSYLGKAARNSPFLKARARIKEMLAQGRDSTALSAPSPPPGTPLN
jgi:putative two-component system response regulator